MGKISELKLNSGRSMPVLGLGTWKSNPGEVGAAVRTAIDIGYRHIDCAFFYQNEDEIGAALADKIHDGTVSREELFITSKLWNTEHAPGAVEPALRRALADLQLTYLDLYLIHFPMSFEAGEDLYPGFREPGGMRYDDVDYLETWRELERLQREGLVRDIGVSNFNAAQLQRLLDHAEVPPAVNQIECHPYLPQKKLCDFCRVRDIAVTAYSPLGSPDSPLFKPGDPKLLEDPQFQAIADKYGKTIAQVLIRYQIDRGNSVIPKSVNPERLQQNLDVFDFHLSRKELDTISSVDRNYRFIHLDWCKTNKYYPFNDEF